MSEKFKDLIWSANAVGNYDFKCWMGKDLKEKNMPKYTSVCLNRFKSFYSTNYRSGREIYIYKWNMENLISRWNRSNVQNQLGKLDKKKLRAFLTRWYALCRQYGMLPKGFIIPKKLNRFYIKNTSDLPPSLFYVYITHLRQVWEEPHFIYNFVTLVDKYKLNPWSSYVVASSISIYNCNHHVLAVSARTSRTVKIGMMFDMRDYFAAPHKKDLRKMKSMGSDAWRIHSKLNGGVEQGFSIDDILESPKKYNKILKMEREAGLQEFAKDFKIKILHNGLMTLGFSPTQYYREPWWLIVRANSEKTAKELVSKIEHTLEGYIHRKINYGVELYLKPKREHLASIIASKRKNFENFGSVSSVPYQDKYVEVKSARRKA